MIISPAERQWAIELLKEHGFTEAWVIGAESSEPELIFLVPREESGYITNVEPPAIRAIVTRMMERIRGGKVYIAPYSNVSGIKRLF